jgi:hypothetical protein
MLMDHSFLIVVFRYEYENENISEIRVEMLIRFCEHSYFDRFRAICGKKPFLKQFVRSGLRGPRKRQKTLN